MATYEDSVPLLRRDLDLACRRLDTLDVWRQNVDHSDAIDTEWKRQINERLDKLERAQQSVSNRLLGLALSVAGGSLMVLMTVLAGTGKI